LADEACSDDNLTIFLRTYSRGTKVYTGGNAVDFVNELYRRWSERSGAVDPNVPPPPEEKSPGAIFLSYASEDRGAAEKLKNRLETEGMDVFFDKDRLEGADEWDKKIRRNIRHCSLFLPLISKNTLTLDRRYFRVEWNAAIEIEKMTPPGEAFLFPILIDETSIREENLPSRFEALQAMSALGGEAPPDLISRIKQLYRRHQLNLSVGAS
jgi:hypothetical protein